MSDTPVIPGIVGPELGQDTELTLLDLGYDWNEIEQLKSSGAV